MLKNVRTTTVIINRKAVEDQRFPPGRNDILDFFKPVEHEIFFLSVAVSRDSQPHRSKIWIEQNGPRLDLSYRIALLLQYEC